MIDCPICHVKNNDDARFCAECGQRLTRPDVAQGSAPQPTHHEPAKPAHHGPRLHSPLLGDPEPEFEEEPVSRRPKPQNGENIQPRRHSGLRSPLLAGEEFEDEEYEPVEEHHAAPRKGGLRSPLLGATDSYNDSYDEVEEESPHSPSGLRSPLLGGGGGAAKEFSGAERRRPQPQTDYSGPERRKSGLRSPILGGAEDYYYDEAEEEEPYSDQDNPNVLRSPLLAAKRPLTDKPRVEAPDASNARAPYTKDVSQDFSAAGQTYRSPSSSYTSLKRVSNVTGGSTVYEQPPAPQQAYPQEPGAPFARPVAAGGMTQQPSYQEAPVQPARMGTGTAVRANPAPSLVAQTAGGGPVANLEVFSGEWSGQQHGPVDPSIAMAMAAGAAQIPAQPLSTAGSFEATPDPMASKPQPSRFASEPINVAPPDSFKQPAQPEPPVQQKPLGRSKMFSQYEDELEPADEGLIQASKPTIRQMQSEAAGPSPMMKGVGGFAVVLLLGKLFAMIGFMSTDFWKFGPFVIDQLVTVGLIICVIAVCFLPRNR